MNAIELISLLKKNCDDDEMAKLLAELFRYESKQNVKWKSSYETIIDKYYEKIDIGESL